MNSKISCEQIFKEAHEAGKLAVEEASIFPMIVTDGVSSYYEEDGVCGFAWVKIRPARGKFVNWCKRNNIGRKHSFETGYMIWVSDYNQSLQKKEAYAVAFASVLNKHGITAYAQSRMD